MWTRASRWSATSWTSRAVCCLPPAPARTRWRWCRCPSHLLFFDARDRRQVNQALSWRASGAGIKPILTGGSYLDLMKAWRVPVYYDQQGLLTRRLGIHQVPALVSQEGLRLRIDELEPKP
jgi:hypothetical protein